MAKKFGAGYVMAPGNPLPQGVHLLKGGVNFALFSRHARKVWLLLYDRPDADVPFVSFELDPRCNKTGDIWHVLVKGASSGLIYAFRVDGPNEPERGHRYDASKVLLDPYATALAGQNRFDPPERHAPKPCRKKTPFKSTAVKCLVTESGFDWQDDRSPNHAWSDLVIYETHVRGLTIHPSAGAQSPGTFLGVIEKIDYFRELGVNAIEFMPLQEFNPKEVTAVNPDTGERLTNFWGYNTVGFFAPFEGYASGSYPGCQVDEFKTMVKALHKAGIEVLLDVVFNHTAEGDETGPTINFRGLDNSIYYILEEDKRRYKNYSGCGNTMNCNHPVVRNYILDCLRYWVVEMHVDGFRFDLASILGRSRDGSLVPNPPLLEQIAEDPILRGVKLIAEAWDAGGAYLVGRFPGERWSEWNGLFRDDIRRYWRGDSAMAGAFASRICGSADIYEHSGKAPVNSINFVTCHDGFTLSDMVSFACKHNLANGEENRDGCGESYSANYGVEGPTKDPEICLIRKRQMRNLMATLFLSRGVPMMLGGDEFCRTQKGNNNAYCQDSELSWVDWGLLDENKDFFNYVKQLIDLRRRYRVFSSERFYDPDEISWFSRYGESPDWQVDSSIGCHIHPKHASDSLCLIANPELNDVDFPLPKTKDGFCWERILDTCAVNPIALDGSGRAYESGAIISMGSRSVALFVQKVD